MKYIQLFERRTITREDNKPYLHRITFLGLGENSSLFSIKGHKIISSDDECLHDHPWPFISIILKGGYTEYREIKPGDGPHTLGRYEASSFSFKNGFGIIPQFFKPGSVLYRPANYAHRLVVTKPCYTLVFTFKRIREWGFFTRKGWIPWTNYLWKRDC